MNDSIFDLCNALFIRLIRIECQINNSIFIFKINISSNILLIEIMDEKQREKIYKNIEKLKPLIKLDSLVTFLLHKRIFNKQMIDSILVFINYLLIIC
jgi:hypothetical protein